VSAYSRGAAFEHRVMAALEARGYTTLRSAGSHSPADIVALRRDGNLLVQAKLDGRCDPAEWNALRDMALCGAMSPILASVGPKRGQFVYRRLTGPKSGTRGERAPSEVFEP
jgi:hypothetical protein